ncbi:MAG: hypothetical protein Q8S57_09585 [Methanoregula sp.]|nr:hypothetical protein [Methanoregula sp.]
MNGLQRSSLNHLSLRLFFICGRKLPKIDFVRLSNGRISENLTCCSISANDRMPVSGHSNQELFEKEQTVEDSPVRLNSENKNSIPAPVRPGRYKLPANRFRNDKQKAAVTRNLVV